MKRVFWRTVWIILGTVVGAILGTAAAWLFGQLAGFVACLGGTCMLVTALATFGALLISVPAGLLTGLFAGIVCPIPHRISN